MAKNNYRAMENKLFKEINSEEEEKLSGGQMLPDVVVDPTINVNPQVATAISNSGPSTGGGNSSAGGATATNNNNV